MIKRFLEESERGATIKEGSKVTDQELVENLHRDMLKLTDAVQHLSRTIEPVAEHLPALVEVAKIWQTGKAVGRTARVLGSFFKWLAGVAVSVVIVYLVVHHRLAEAVGLNQ